MSMEHQKHCCRGGAHAPFRCHCFCSCEIKAKCHSCGFERKCSEYINVMLCKKCFQEALEDATETIGGSTPPTTEELLELDRNEI